MEYLPYQLVSRVSEPSTVSGKLGSFGTCNENSYPHHYQPSTWDAFLGAKDPAILQRPPGRLAHPERRTPEALLFWSAATAPEQHLARTRPTTPNLTY